MLDDIATAGQGSIVGVVLAGGLSRRMGGGDKALIDLCGRPLLAHVIERFRPQVGPLLVSANGDPGRFSAFGLEVVADPVSDYPGPLAGLAAACLWARANRPRIGHVATVAADLPLLPSDLVARLAAALARNPRAGCAVAASRGRVHPVAALHPVDCVDELLPGLASGEIRRLMTWFERKEVVTVDFEGVGIDPFVNLNSPEDMALLRATLSG
jgi:molybdenum cofactor guanylyltransferase